MTLLCSETCHGWSSFPAFFISLLFAIFSDTLCIYANRCYWWPVNPPSWNLHEAIEFVWLDYCCVPSIYVSAKHTVDTQWTTVEWMIKLWNMNEGLSAYSVWMSEVSQSCPTLCDPLNCSLPGYSVHGILQARILEWVAISFSRGSSWSRDQTWVSCVTGRRFMLWTTR